jgi:hypothetical protein
MEGSALGPLTLEEATAAVGKIKAEVEEIDSVLGLIIEKFNQDCAPFHERRAKLMAAWQALYNLAPYPSSSTQAALEKFESQPPAAIENGKRTPRTIMLDLLRASTGPVSSWDLADVVKRAGLEPKMTGNELVYQTLYAAKKAGHPIERNEDGSWHWIRDNAA